MSKRTKAVWISFNLRNFCVPVFKIDVLSAFFIMSNMKRKTDIFNRQLFNKMEYLL